MNAKLLLDHSSMASSVVSSKDISESLGIIS